MKKLFFLMFLSFLIGGCSTATKEVKEDVPLPPKPKDKKEGKWVPIKEFPVLKNYRLKLELLTPRRKFYFGDKVVLTYKLTNLGRKTLLIQEWYEKEALNIRYYYYRYKKRVRGKIPLKKWKAHIPKVTKDSKHMTLQLDPNRSILISVELPFIKALKGKRRTRKYYFFVQLNLKTVKVKSRIERFIVKKKSEYEAFLEQEALKEKEARIKRERQKLEEMKRRSLKKQKGNKNI